MIVWDDHKYSVGNKVLDNQHKKIVSMINELCENTLVDMHSEILHDTLNNMRLYMQEHLKFEEKLLAELGYQDLESHIILHTEYLEMFSEISMEAVEQDVSVVVDLQTFLLHWWENHILVEDMNYKPLMSFGE